MKDLRLSKQMIDTNPIITNYEINNGKIIVHYSNKTIRTLPYNKESEYSILKEMKDQAIMIIDYIEVYEDIFRKNLETSMADSLLTIISASISTAIPNNCKYIGLLATLLFGGFAIYNGKKTINYDKKIEEIKKYKYYIENEDLINNEIVSRFFDFYGIYSDPNYANRITINDIDKYTLEDLENIVGLIKSSDEYKLKHSK